MHAVKLNIHDDVFEKFMGLVDILPKQSVTIEQIDDVPYYPTISHDEACKKVEKSVSNISKNLGEPVDKAFDDILN